MRVRSANRPLGLRISAAPLWMLRCLRMEVFVGAGGVRTADSFSLTRRHTSESFANFSRKYDFYVFRQRLMLLAVGASDMCAVAISGGLSIIWLGSIHIGRRAVGVL